MKESINKLLEKDLVIGYVYGYDGGRKVFYFEKSHANVANFIVAGSSQDTGSGLEINRPGLLEALQAAEEGKTDALLVKKLDRISRDTPKTIGLLQNLKQLGITIYSPLEGEINIEQQGLNLSMR